MIVILIVAPLPQSFVTTYCISLVALNVVELKKSITIKMDVIISAP